MREGLRAPAPSALDEKALVEILEEDVRTYRWHGTSVEGVGKQIPKWEGLAAHEPAKFIRPDGSVNLEVLRNFRRLSLFIPDNPIFDSSLSLKNLVSGARRGERRMMRECLDLFLQTGEEHLLRAYPAHPAGNPRVFEHRGYRYTHRWLKHLHSLGLFNRVLAGRLQEGFICLDIGSSYGIWTSLLKREHPHSCHVLVDFPGQLLLARYFLSTCLPHLKIAGLKELGEEGTIGRSQLEQHDVVLLPCDGYRRLSGGSVDVVTNFASLGEMTRRWFEFYLEADVFRQARYWFTANRIQSQPTYDTDLNILDYPIWDPDRRLYFGISPMFSNHYWYRPRAKLFSERIVTPPYFEYIGRPA
ncbi:MAG: putative sugar O-methyltransferase [Candidatus Omnitrophica bacterium]|nr:putative sugar O-methyltransferase [Candidatus Omnitrophota bacterium]